MAIIETFDRIMELHQMAIGRIMCLCGWHQWTRTQKPNLLHLGCLQSIVEFMVNNYSMTCHS